MGTPRFFTKDVQQEHIHGYTIYIGYNRVIMFWFVLLVMTTLVICFITTPMLDWDQMNNGMASTDEVSCILKDGWVVQSTCILL